TAIMSTRNDRPSSILALLLASLLTGCQVQSTTSPSATPPQPAAEPAPPPPPPAEPTQVGAPAKRPSGLVYETLKEGTGLQVQPGDTVTIHYTAALEDGKPFDSTRDAKRPVIVDLGKSTLIQGWKEGIAGMKVGERRKLTVPSSLAYGSLGRLPVIP